MKIEQKYTEKDFNKLTQAEFHNLWFVRAYTEKQIAKMYGVTKEQVHKKRKELKLGWFNSGMLYVAGGKSFKGKKP